MVFIRLKKSKGNTYASLVKSVYNNEYQDKKEIVLKNLGRVYFVSSQSTLSFPEFLLQYYSYSVSDIFTKLDFVSLMNFLVEYYLFTFNFVSFEETSSHSDYKELNKSLKKKNYSCSFLLYLSDSLFILYNTDSHSFVDSRFFRDCTLKHNRGYFNTYTIQSLFNFKEVLFRKSINFDDQLKHIFISRLMACGIFLEPQYLVLLYNKFSAYFKEIYLSSIQYSDETNYLDSDSDEDLAHNLEVAMENAAETLNISEDEISKNDFISQFL